MNKRLSYTSQREDLDLRRKRLLIRCWHRETQEADLILGAFAEQSIDKMRDAQLERLEALLDSTDADLFDWLLGNRMVPAEHDHDVIRLLRGFCGARPHSILRSRPHQI